ncbi:hypothetical protein SAMN05216403_14312 [Nitrosospira multiformis ATCC 25196]|uniref:Uncharacterized protein n=1 Tax=Nitrosospira multiformis (strain ATCC 25196 / NCIMB 11849 / C 71) TaxID=323848 RepID=A0A1H5Y3Z2_NITMU|nr:hypothetical protein [Nitrosospira multiformis]SEG18246.1 hypothetical protein SAMN05216403_14312 [Nitrosospira multiformis ATCC 25196]
MENTSEDTFDNTKRTLIRRRLFQIGVETLEGDGWTVERIPKIGKGSVRRITKGKKSYITSIRTTQDTWIAFPPEGNKQWTTLSDVDKVIVISVDPDNSELARVHMIEGDDLRERFDRAFAARRAAGYSLPMGQGIWLPLYEPDAENPVTHVGGGAGIGTEIARVPLEQVQVSDKQLTASKINELNADDETLTISEAKRRLAMTFGVDPSNIKITVEG